MALRSPLRVGLALLSLWPFMPIVARAPLYGRLLGELLFDGRVPASRKAFVGLAAAYLVSPIDLIPDFVPLISRLDDVAVVVVALDLFLEGVPRHVLLDRMYALGIDGRELERDLESVRRFLPEPIRSALRRLPDYLEAGSALVRDRLAIGRGTADPRRTPSQ
jgi:uncharacterized membrane protein YkvA (DUF1232 family)